VSRGVALRSVSLGGPPDAEADVAMARLEGRLGVVVAGGRTGVTFTLLDGALKRHASRKLGEGRAPAVATRGADLFVAWLSNDDRLIVVRLDTKDGRELARTELAVPSPPPFPAVTLITKNDRVFFSVRSGAAAVQLASATRSLETPRTLLVDASDGALVADGDDVHLLTREGDDEIVLRRVADDLVLARGRAVDHDSAAIGITGAFGPGHVLALPRVLVPPSGDAVRRSTHGRLVERLLWVGAHVVALETSAEHPTLVVTTGDLRSRCTFEPSAPEHVRQHLRPTRRRRRELRRVDANAATANAARAFRRSRRTAHRAAIRGRVAGVIPREGSGARLHYSVPNRGVARRCSNTAPAPATARARSTGMLFVCEKRG
jgi:hypothetical protein